MYACVRTTPSHDFICIINDYVNVSARLTGVALMFLIYTNHRSVAANASDQILCMQLAQNAVHAAMAGYTSFTVGLVNNKVCAT
jgi:6-phosphofructokinase